MRYLAPLERKLISRADIGIQEREIINARFGKPKVVEARTELSFVDDRGRRAFLVEEGWACTYKILRDGTRQVIGIAIPGDIIGVGSLVLHQCDLLAATVTTAVIRDLTAPAFHEILETSTKASLALLWANFRDENVVMEHLVGIGRRSSTERVAHFMLELYERLRLVDLAADGRFRCPLSQPLIADALGLTAIHLNRTLRDLRLRNLMIFRDGTVHLTDVPRLVALAGYDPGYLDQAMAPPRASGPGRYPQTTDSPPSTTRICPVM